MFSMFESQSWKRQYSNQNRKVDRKFQLFQVPCKIVKEFETEI